MNFLFFAGAGFFLSLLIVIFVILFPLIALITVLVNNYPGNEKVVWVLVIIFLPFLGSLLYFLLGHPRRQLR